jgi:hypothetical protein
MHGGGNQRMSGFIGKAGEHAVAAQLLLRGLDVGFLSVGIGVDLVAENGCRIQVKSGHLGSSDGRNAPAYTLLLRKNMVRSRTKNEVVPRKPFVEVCDFVVYWGIEQNRFWIIPPRLCDSCYSVRLGQEPRSRPRLVADFASVKSMVDLGYSQSHIAKHYGTTRCVIQRFLSGGKDWDQSLVSQMRACENDWGKILDFSRTTTTVPVEEKVQEG